MTTFDAIPTPKDYETFKQNLLEIKERASQEYTITGVGMSMPERLILKHVKLRGLVRFRIFITVLFLMSLKRYLNSHLRLRMMLTARDL